MNRRSKGSSEGAIGQKMGTIYLFQQGECPFLRLDLNVKTYRINGQALEKDDEAWDLGFVITSDLFFLNTEGSWWKEANFAL